MEEKSLFFIAIIPPKILQKEISTLKMKFSTTFESSHALKSPTHITLVPPFRLSDAAANEIGDALKEFCCGQAKFNLKITGFGAFIPRVIYLRIAESKRLSTLWTELKKYFRDVDSGTHFTPHITIATRDLSKQMFHRAWNIYKHESFTRDFEVSSLTMLKHTGKNWDIYMDYPFIAE